VLAKQEYLGDDDDDEPGIFYERPDVDDEEAYLKLCPFVVGKNTEIKDIPESDANWTAFSDGEDTEGEENEDEDEVEEEEEA
jgi:hypothetical protein